MKAILGAERVGVAVQEKSRKPPHALKKWSLSTGSGRLFPAITSKSLRYRSNSEGVRHLGNC